MTRPPSPRSVRSIAALAIVAGLALSACSSSPSATSTTTTPSSSAATSTAATSSSAADTGSTSAASSTADAAAFPVTIKHAFGETTIAAAPTKVVTISWQNQDVALALGVDPVAIAAQPYGGDDQGLLPWVKDALAGKTTPVLMDEANGLDFEAITAAKPDVILGAYSGLSQQDYDTLSKIAPTVAYPKTAYGTDWKDTTTIIGEALGKSAEAAKLVADTQDYVKTIGEKYPQLAGKTFAYGAFPNDTELNVYMPTDARVSLLTGLGLEVAPSVEELAKTATTFYSAVPFEKLDTVTSDILILIADDDAAKASILANPFIAALPQVKSGAYAVIVGKSFVMSTSAPSVLSIPWGFDQFVPDLAAAADKVA